MNLFKKMKKIKTNENKTSVKCTCCNKYKEQKNMNSLYECIDCFEVRFLESLTDDGSWVGR